MYSDLTTELRGLLDEAPKKPGVYIFSNSSGEKIYVGKAVNLYNRSRSYFANYKRLDPRLQIMVSNIVKVDYIEVDNEVEALLLETNLIKKYDPKFNIMMTDDKSYVWVKIESDLDFPRVTIVHQKKEDGADYFGPYPARGPVKRLLRNMRKIFVYRSCTRVIEERENGEVYSEDHKPCLYYHLGLCNAPCTTQIGKQEYRQMINNLKRFLRADHADLKADLRKQMTEYSRAQNFEKAAEIRDQLKDIDYVTKFSRVDEQVDDVVFAQRKLQQSQQGIAELVERLELGIELSAEKLKNFRIECYDISNIQGTNATAAMTVAVGGEKRPNLYRKFKIQTKDTPDDFAMLRETLTRRLKYLLPDPKKQDESFSQWPDLILIDGGKGQLSSALQVMAEFLPRLDRDIPCVGLAKREEEIVVPLVDTEGEGKGELKFELKKLSRRSAALKLLQLVRDEAHRFGLGYHRLLRSKGMVYSELDLIPGVGAETKKKLLLAFGSVAKIKAAKLEDIETVVKNRNTARKLKKLLV